MGHLSDPVLDVLIVGAGPTGLAMAAEASRFGLRYRIIDKASHGAQQSQAIVLQARTLEQFERYEIAQSAMEVGRRLRCIRMYSEGARIVEASFEEMPGNYPFVLFLPQTQTERLLAEHIEAQGGVIEREVALEYFVQREGVVECVVLGKTGARDTVTAAYLVGADGAHSTVREVLGMPFEGDLVDFEFFVGDLRLEGDVPGDELAIHLRGGNLVFLGRLDDTHCRVIVAPHESPGGREPELDDFQRAIDVVGIENLRVSDARWMANFRVSERRTPAYSSGRVFLAGDATNVHAPIGGQGMNSGIQDAANLIWKISLVESRRGRPLLLESYDRERKPVSDKLVKETGFALRAATASNWLLERIRDAIFARVGSLPALQQHFREAVSELGLHYRHSPIVCECGGSSLLHAGDRVPDCEVTAETSARFRIFELLKETVHTALMVAPPPSADLKRFSGLFSRYRDIMNGIVLIDGDELFRTHYMQSGGALYVIRPDGYVGFRGSPNDLEALEAWADGLFVTAEKP
jgi:2-polyprenyl-6-methoxyphenol hydroxylase-like FAD-dependent oxidoreductase